MVAPGEPPPSVEYDGNSTTGWVWRFTVDEGIAPPGEKPARREVKLEWSTEHETWQKASRVDKASWSPWLAVPELPDPENGSFDHADSLARRWAATPKGERFDADE